MFGFEMFLQFQKILVGEVAKSATLRDRRSSGSFRNSRRIGDLGMPIHYVLIHVEQIFGGVNAMTAPILRLVQINSGYS
jgi:hypothetical protein